MIIMIEVDNLKHVKMQIPVLSNTLSLTLWRDADNLYFLKIFIGDFENTGLELQV